MLSLSIPLFALPLALSTGHDEPPASTFPSVPLPRPCAVCGFAPNLGFVQTLNAVGPETGQGAVSARLEMQEIDRYSDAQLLASSTAGIEAHSYDRRYAARLGGIYGVTDDVAFGVDLPYVYNSSLREADTAAPPGIEDGGSQDGLGDMSIYGMWTAGRKPVEGGQRAIAFYAGAKLPSGDTQQKNPAGDRLEPDHQLGSGSVDPLVGVALSTVEMGWSLGLSGLYTIATDGSQDSNLGDVLRTSLAIGNEVASLERNGTAVLLMLEFGFEHRERARIDGAIDENTGGTQWFVSPGLRATIDSGWSFYGSVSVPLAEDLEGEQAATQLRTAFGVAKAF